MHDIAKQVRPELPEFLGRMAEEARSKQAKEAKEQDGAK